MMFGWFKKQQVDVEAVAQRVTEMINEQKYWISPEWLNKAPASPQADTWDTNTAITDGYKASTVTYACIEKRATSVASIPFVAQKQTKDGWENLENHPLQALLDRPNPNQTWGELMEGAIQHLDLSGNAYIHIVRAGNRPKELWLLDPRAIKIKAGDRENIIAFYEYKTDVMQSKVQIPWQDMLHLKYSNPENQLYGISPMMASGRAIDTDKQAGIWQKSSLENRGVSDIAVVLDKDTTATQYEKLKEIHSSNYQGASNARKTLFTTRDVKPLGMTAVELDFSNSRGNVWVEICAAFGVPPVMIGIYENATLANIETGRKIFWRDTIIPLLNKLTTQITNQLAIDFGQGLRVSYDTSGVDALQEGLDARIANAQKLWAMGVPLDVLNQMFDLNIPEGVNGLDSGYVSAGIIPIDMAGASMASGEPTDEQAQKALNLAYGRK